MQTILAGSTQFSAILLEDDIATSFHYYATSRKLQFHKGISML